MANLKQEYIDIKDVKHHVEHLTIPEQENSDREQLVRELFILLTKSTKKLPTYGRLRAGLKHGKRRLFTQKRPSSAPKTLVI